ncbi:MAG: hypothetical protein KTR29_17045 [Rhodothermaceae bacterium]|nr:hypothetical protein [Rhodothermaceae bacterium]
MSRRICIEACIASVEDAIAAYEGGADRLELNMALRLDGLTPSLGLLREVKAAVPLPVIVMIRPRAFGFYYSSSEFTVMQTDIDAFLQEGIAGFAFGILTTEQEIDVPRTRQIVHQIKGVESVFHRAFDITPNPDIALNQLVDLGISRILTSGHMPTAPQGMENLRNLQQKAASRIEILPGSGVNTSNVAALLAQTGCTQIHGTFRPPIESQTLTGLDTLRAHPPQGTSKEIVREIRTIVDALKQDS